MVESVRRQKKKKKEEEMVVSPSCFHSKWWVNLLGKKALILTITGSVCHTYSHRSISTTVFSLVNYYWTIPGKPIPSVEGGGTMKGYLNPSDRAVGACQAKKKVGNYCPLSLTCLPVQGWVIWLSFVVLKKDPLITTSIILYHMVNIHNYIVNCLENQLRKC